MLTSPGSWRRIGRLGAVIIIVLAGVAWWWRSAPRAMSDEEFADVIRPLLPMLMPQADALGAARRVPHDGRTAWLYPALRDGREIGLVAIGSGLNGYGGKLTVAVGVEDGGVVGRIVIVAHRETPGIGDQFDNPPADDAGSRSAGRRMLDRLRGRQVASAPWRLADDGGDIDAVSGATVTSRAIIEAVNHAVAACP